LQSEPELGRTAMQLLDDAVTISLLIMVGAGILII
jgi:hypothetical protein